MSSKQTSRSRHLACNLCRERKVRCNGAQPTCDRCSKAPELCVYTPMRGLKTDLHDTVQQLWDRVEKQEAALMARPQKSPDHGLQDPLWSEVDSMGMPLFQRFAESKTRSTPVADPSDPWLDMSELINEPITLMLDDDSDRNDMTSTDLGSSNGVAMSVRALIPPISGHGDDGVNNNTVIGSFARPRLPSLREIQQRRDTSTDDVGTADFNRSRSATLMEGIQDDSDTKRDSPAAIMLLEEYCALNSFITNTQSRIIGIADTLADYCSYVRRTQRQTPSFWKLHQQHSQSNRSGGPGSSEGIELNALLETLEERMREISEVSVLHLLQTAQRSRATISANGAYRCRMNGLEDEVTNCHRHFAEFFQSSYDVNTTIAQQHQQTSQFLY